MGSETEAQRDRGTEEGKRIRQKELAIWRQRIQGFPVQALPLQVPESPELLSSGLKVSSLSVISGGGEPERGRGGYILCPGPPAILEPFLTKNSFKRASQKMMKI